MSDNTLTYPEWTKRGKMLLKTTCLEMNDPESVPSIYKKKFGSLVGFPWKEVFGKDFEPPATVCPHCNKIIK